MRKIIADIHSHTIASGHAYGTIREMAQAAQEKGLLFYGVSEHGTGIPGTCLDIYFDNLKIVLPEMLYGVRLLCGIEANVLNDGTISNQKVLDILDYVIVGIHGLCYKDAGKDINTDNVISCMKHPNVYVVSHPDDDHTPLDYERLVLAAKEYHVALEVNNSSFLKKHNRWNCVENYRTMCQLCMKYQVPIMVNSDAHDPSRVARVQEAMAFLEEIGFDEDLIINNDAEKFAKFMNLK